MTQVNHNGKVFQINDEMQAQYNELINLVLETESMDDDEKQYWFDIMPSMTHEQVDRLYDILETEKRKLGALEDKYQNEIKELNEKHLIEWQEFQLKDSKKKIKKAEATDTSEEEAEDVLKMLNDL